MNFHPHAFPELWLQPETHRSTIDRELMAIAAGAPMRRTSRLRSLARFAVRRLVRNDLTTTAPITIRPATPRDQPQLAQLGQLDERAVAERGLLVAEVDARIVAGVPVATGEVVADPLRAQRDVVLLLELRAAQLAA